eukprot:TRINITY_DN10893_c0_g4_i1.p2 TRINITY_DN10893_c0_g4~~TRINITY_DN10893_c0_g4_i1.p2  ORF type:complete len:188 (+),score=94.61 TRINITY_DN10893_c0_g4_i1:100-663(+)
MSTTLKPLTDTKDVDWKTHLVVETKDRKKYALPRDCVKMVGLIHDLLQDSEEGMPVEMQLPEVDSDTLICVWKYLENYRNGEPERLEKPLKDDLKSLVPDMDWQYITTELLEDGDEKKHEKLFYTLQAANFMNIEPLRDLCCAQIANMLRGKNEQEIFHLFNIEAHFTPEEEERLYQEYEWLREKRD